MKAEDLALHGENIVGHHVFTFPMGGYPGGMSVITDVPKYREEENICMYVANIATPEEEIGAFDDEEVIPYGINEYGEYVEGIYPVKKS